MAKLPAKPIIQLGKWTWTTMWQVMMSQLAPRDAAGAYQRPSSQFRHSVGSGEYGVAADRYSLYVGMSCPWAHRTLMVRALKGVEEAVSVTVVVPDPLVGGWVFPTPDQGCKTLAELYTMGHPGYDGRATVPILWDRQTHTIVNNESAEIIVQLNGAFNEMALHPNLDLYSEADRPSIDQWNERIYHSVNNGVYRCGFAQTQSAYDEAVTGLFGMLDELEALLGQQRYVVGDRLTLTDVRLFTTLIRFDLAYYGLLKCSRQRIQDYPHLSGYLREIYQLQGVAATCDPAQVRRDYYGNLFPLNPGGIMPVMPDLRYLQVPHGRG